MSEEDRRNILNRRKVLKTTGAAVGGGLTLGATGTAAASGSGDGSEEECNVQVISENGNSIVTLVEVFGDKFLFKEAAEYRKADDVSAQSAVTTYEATESGYPLEFQKINPSVSASDISSDGTIQTQDVGTQSVDFTPENFVKRYDVDTKQISNSCGDIAFNDHDALEFHFEGGGAFSSIGVSALAGVLCYAAGASASIPTAGLSGLLAAGVCSGLTAAVDQLIDVDMIPNSVELSVAFWDVDQEYPFNTNTSPTVVMGLEPGWEVQWHEMSRVGEYDANVHLGLPQ